MPPAPSHGPWLAALVLRGLVLFLPLIGALWQTSCWVYVSDCDDDDDDNDDDDYCHDDDDDDDGGGLRQDSGTGSPGSDATVAAPLAVAGFGLRLTTFDLVSSDDPGAHAVRRLIGIEDIALRKPESTADFAAREFEDFTKLVLFENWDLIGLPSSSGRLVFDGVEFLADEVRVRYRQESAFPLVWLAGSDSPGAMTFLFDRQGNLVEIDNTTRIRVGG
jgi:hypothetical protein